MSRNFCLHIPIITLGYGCNTADGLTFRAVPFKSPKNEIFPSKYTYSKMQKALGELDVAALGFLIPYIIRSSVASSSVTGCVGII